MIEVGVATVPTWPFGLDPAAPAVYGSRNIVAPLLCYRSPSCHTIGVAFPGSHPERATHILPPARTPIRPTFGEQNNDSASPASTPHSCSDTSRGFGHQRGTSLGNSILGRGTSARPRMNRTSCLETTTPKSERQRYAVYNFTKPDNFINRFGAAKQVEIRLGSNQGCLSCPSKKRLPIGQKLPRGSSARVFSCCIAEIEATKCPPIGWATRAGGTV